MPPSPGGEPGDLGAGSSEAAANDDKGHKNDIVNNNNNNNGSMFSPGTPGFMRQHQQQGYWGGASPAPAEHHQRQHQGQNYPRVKRAEAAGPDQAGRAPRAAAGAATWSTGCRPALLRALVWHGATRENRSASQRRHHRRRRPAAAAGAEAGQLPVLQVRQLKKGRVCPFTKQAKASTNQQQQSPSPGRGRRGSGGELCHFGGAAMADPTRAPRDDPARAGRPRGGRVPFGNAANLDPATPQAEGHHFHHHQGVQNRLQSPPQQQRFVRDHRGQGARRLAAAASGRFRAPHWSRPEGAPESPAPAIFSRPSARSWTRGSSIASPRSSPRTC